MPKLVAALDAGSPPDVTYADTYHFQGAGKWASEGKLVDLGSVLAPIKGEFSPQSLETVMLYNDKTKAKAYYAFPLKQATLHLHYWKDMLEEGGLKETVSHRLGHRGEREIDGPRLVVLETCNITLCRLMASFAASVSRFSSASIGISQFSPLISMPWPAKYTVAISAPAASRPNAIRPRRISSKLALVTRRTEKPSRFSAAAMSPASFGGLSSVGTFL